MSDFLKQFSDDSYKVEEEGQESNVAPLDPFVTAGEESSQEVRSVDGLHETEMLDVATSEQDCPEAMQSITGIDEGSHEVLSEQDHQKDLSEIVQQPIKNPKQKIAGAAHEIKKDKIIIIVTHDESISNHFDCIISLDDGQK